MIYDSVADKDRYECENIGGNVFQADGTLVREKTFIALVRTG